VLHLFAAAAWLGGLVSLALLFAAVRRRQRFASDVARCRRGTQVFDAGHRLRSHPLASGFIHGLGSGRARFERCLSPRWATADTQGRRFHDHAAFAAVNRLRLTPQLVGILGCVRSSRGCFVTRRNFFIEIILGLTIFALVGALGTMHPAAHFCHLWNETIKKADCKWKTNYLRSRPLIRTFTCAAVAATLFTAPRAPRGGQGW